MPASASPEQTAKEQIGRLDLTLSRVIAVPPALVWTVWTTPEHLMQWFCPRPWRTVECEMDLRPGCRFFARMQGPNGEDMPMLGCFLEIVEGRRLVFTDALHPEWRPATNPFFTAIVTIEPEGSGTRYTAIARHKDDADRKKHEEMGFQTGWGTVLDQLVEVAQGLM
jgi:uncharacterized protein YndB with AHSA1/START domain